MNPASAVSVDASCEGGEGGEAGSQGGGSTRKGSRKGPPQARKPAVHTTAAPAATAATAATAREGLQHPAYDSASGFSQPRRPKGVAGLSEVGATRVAASSREPIKSAAGNEASSARKSASPAATKASMPMRSIVAGDAAGAARATTSRDASRSRHAVHRPQTTPPSTA